MWKIYDSILRTVLLASAAAAMLLLAFTILQNNCVRFKMMMR
jgi:hypothetical protein